MRYLFIPMFLLPVFGYGQQNIVPNPSFEDHIGCPDNQGLFWMIPPWQNTVGGGDSPDFFHSCGPPLVFPPDTVPHMGVPDNVWGWQHARTGNGYVGFYAADPIQVPNGREYVQVKLNEPIHAGVRYEVSFHVSLVDDIQFALSTLGVHFSQNVVVRENGLVLQVMPQIENQFNRILDDKLNWMEVRDTFNSRYGGEQYMVIGNFRPDAESNITFVDSGASVSHNKSYYYLDDVSVIAVDSGPSSIEEPERLSFSVFPNPATDVIRIVGVEQLRHLRLADLRGREVMTEEISGHDHSLSIGHLPAGLYIMEVTAEDGRRATQRVIRMAGP